MMIILLTLSLDSVWILLGENFAGHYWDLKGNPFTSTPCYGKNINWSILWCYHSNGITLVEFMYVAG